MGFLDSGGLRRVWGAVNTSLAAKADKGQPQRFLFPAASGFECVASGGLAAIDCSYYTKDQFGIVHVHAFLKCKNAVSDATVGTLPEGYRYGGQIYSAGACVYPPKIFTTFTNDLGQILVNFGGSVAAGTHFQFYFSYLAGKYAEGG